MKDSSLEQEKSLADIPAPNAEEAGKQPAPPKKKGIQKPKELEDERLLELEAAEQKKERARRKREERFQKEMEELEEKEKIFRRKKKKKPEEEKPKVQDPDEDEDELDELDDTPRGGTMSLLSHLGELRRRLFFCAMWFLVAVILCFTRSEWFCNMLLSRGSQFAFVYIRPAELLMAYVRISLIGGLVASVPIIVFHIWQFVRPGLRKREQFRFMSVMLIGLVLFTLGAYFSFEIVLPILLDFFVRLETANTVSAMVSVEEYLNYVVSNMITFGLIFETPVVVVTLTGLGLVKPQFLQRNFKYIILIVLVVAAIITPPDITSQVLVAVPLLVLFYASILLSRLIFRRKLAKKAAEEAAENENN